MKELILLLQADIDIQSAFSRYEDFQEGRASSSFSIWMRRSP